MCSPCSAVKPPPGLITYLCTVGVDRSDTDENVVGDVLYCDAVSSVRNGVTGASELGKRRSEEETFATKGKPIKPE